MRGNSKVAVPQVKIAVIGAGPKAAALAAKAEALRSAGLGDVRITIFEHQAIGANWTGEYGYTDGEQELCTLAEKDVAFPDKSLYGRDVNLRMAEFSWANYLRHTSPSAYHEWVDDGRRPEPHGTFAEYLAWVIAKTNVRVIPEKVVELVAIGSKWGIVTDYSRQTSQAHRLEPYDAVVVTGPGEPNESLKVDEEPGLTLPAGRIFNGKDFWQRLPEVQALIAQLQLDPDKGPIVVAGSGGTGAAVLAWLVANGAKKLTLQLISEMASIYTRLDSPFENRLFSDESLWPALTKPKQDEFFDRTNRGVVWDKVTAVLAAAKKNLQYAYGRADTKLMTAANGFQVKVTGTHGPLWLSPALFVDATGFNRWWFLDLLRSSVPSGKPPSAWEEDVGYNLQLQSGPWSTLPPLHAPMCAKRQGPGFGSLMVLGAMSDRILEKYVRVPPRTRSVGP